MNTTNMMPTQMEILAMAREMLLDKYMEEKAKTLFKWSAMNDWSWQTTGKLLDFPDLPEYPTMEEVMALAKSLQEYFTEIYSEGSTEPTTTEPLSIFEPNPGVNDGGS